MSIYKREPAMRVKPPLLGAPRKPAADRVQASATNQRTRFPIDKRELPNMSPEQWAAWEHEMCGPW